jgi:Domain of unknown function (DUF3943)
MVKILLITIILITSIGIKAYGYNYDRGPIASDIYEDTPHVLVSQPVTIDLTSERPKLRFDSTVERSITKDFGDFARLSLVPYTWNWLERAIIAPHNVKVVFTNFPEGWMDNISHWQDCKVGKCAYPNQRAPFWAPPLNDGDYLKTNYVEHPLSGAATYLYYRALSYDRVSAFIGSFMQSLIFEYTVEGFQQPPSFNDIIATPVLGSALGIVLEESSDWFADRDSQFFRALSYIVNPFRILTVEHDASVQNFGGISFRFNWY